MKTLKEAYESVGETIQVGDVLCGFCEIEYAEGWNYALKGDSVLLYRAEKIKYPVTNTITRNGKQIYPRAEEELVREKAIRKAELAYRKQQLIDELSVIFTDDGIREATIIYDAISSLIDAKIQEKMGG